MGWFLAHPILNTEPEDSGLYGAARAVQDTTGELYAMLHGGFPCADHVRRALHAALTGEVAGIWPPGRPAHLGHVGDVIRSVICDARGEAVARAVRGRADVRRVMMGFGLSKPRIQGISPGEKFEDGRTAEDIIKTAVRVPALIGRMEDS